MIAENPLISVVVPVYNGEKYVKQCLENMLSQSYRNLEIIVVNDGSADKSAEIARQFPVKVIDFDRNRGLSAARNTGMDAATGAYLHFMDVDDTINKDYYKALAKAITESGADIACGGMINTKKHYKTYLFSKQEVYTSLPKKLRATYVGKWGYVWRYLFKTDFLKQHNLRFEEGRFIEDLMFSVPAVFYAEKLVVVPGAEYTYIHRENSIMTSRDKAHLEKRRRDGKYAHAFVKDFARRHNFKMPGVTTGKLAYIIRKLYKNLIASK